MQLPGTQQRVDAALPANSTNATTNLPMLKHTDIDIDIDIHMHISTQ